MDNDYEALKQLLLEVGDDTPIDYEPQPYTVDPRIYDTSENDTDNEYDTLIEDLIAAW